MPMDMTLRFKTLISGGSAMTEESRREKREDERFCYECGEVVKKAAVVCVHCGVPLTPMTTPMEGQAAQTRTGMEPKLAGALSYLLTWLTGIIFLLTNKEDNFVRFHAWQAIAFGVSTVIAWFVIFIFFTVVAFIPIIGGIIAGILATLVWIVFSIGFLILWIVLMIKAYQGQRFKLPVIGDYAENWSKSSAG